MQIKDANTLFGRGDYQASLVRYIENAHFSNIHKGTISINISFARRKLYKALINLANESHGDLSSRQDNEHQEGILAYLTLPALEMDIGQGHFSHQTFWRLDCVVAGNQGLLDVCPAFRVLSHKIQPTREASDGIELKTAIFCLDNARCFSDNFTGTSKASSATIAWSVRRLSASEFIANFFEESRICTRQQDNANSNTEERVVVEALRAYLFKTSGTRADDHFLRALAQRYQTWSNACCPSGCAWTSDTYEHSRPPTVQGRHLLASGVNFNMEGAKYLNGLLVIHGWILDPTCKISSLRARPSGSETWRELLHERALFSRPDVDLAFGLNQGPEATPPGFAVCIEIDCWFAAPSHVEVLVHCQEAGTTYVETLQVTDLNALPNGLEYILGIIPGGKVTSGQCRYFYGPLFTQSQRVKAGASFTAQEFIKPSAVDKEKIKPAVSIIIPLYGPKRFETTQIPVIASMGRPDWQIILAVDDPAIEEVVLDNVRRLSLNYSVDIKVVCASSNLGFASINNLAAQAVDAQHLLFLNSDCFITCVEPIDKALKWLDLDDTHGACGFRLHYADMTIQHDGMSDGLLDDDAFFHLNLHPRMGQPASTIPKEMFGDSARMVTAACLMMSKSLFQQIGGFEECYFRGDFEDSDICLKILSIGKKIGIVRIPGIFHLERQSISAQEPGLRQRITLANSWLYSVRWGRALQQFLPELELVS